MKMTHIALALFVSLTANGLMAKGTERANANPNAPLAALTTISGTPLRVNVGDDMSFQVFNTTISSGTVGQIFPSSAADLADMGWFVRLGTALYAPSFNEHSGTATSGLGATIGFGARTVSAISGAGTTASPFLVTTTGTLATGIAASQRVTYVNGENFFRKALTLNNSGAAAISARVFLGSDIFLAASDSGKPFRETVSGSPGGRTCPGVTPIYTILHISQGTPASNGFSGTGFNSIWTQIGAGTLNNAINPADCIDNGAALQWDVSIPAGGSTIVSAVTSFGDIPGGGVIGPGPAAIITQVPATNMFGMALLGLGMLGLVGFGIRRYS